MLDSPVQAARKIASVIEAADDEVLFSSGRLVNSCYDTDQVINSVSKAQENGVKFFVLTGPQPDNNRFLSMLKDSIFVAPSIPRVHFAIADGGKKLRIEKSDIDKYEHTENTMRNRDYVTGSYLRDKLFATLPLTKPYNNPSQ